MRVSSSIVVLILLFFTIMNTLYAMEREWIIKNSIGGTGVKAIDSDPNTFWGTQGIHQSPSIWFQVDIQKILYINKISLRSHSTKDYYPRKYNIFISEDERSWGSAVATVNGKMGIQDVTFTPKKGRYIKIQLAQSYPKVWRIYDLNVFSQDISPTREEIGLVASGLWYDGLGFRSRVKTNRQYYSFWTGDNALMLWALSLQRYPHSQLIGWGKTVRDSLFDAYDGKGHFNEGYRMEIDDANPNNKKVYMSPPETSPAMEPQVLQGIIHYTLAFPNENGKRSAQQYIELISNAINFQHEKVMNKQEGFKTNTGTGLNHDFTKPSTISYHIWNCVKWYKYTNKSQYLEMANKAWPLLKVFQGYNGTFSDSTMRNAQILYNLTEILKLQPNFSDMSNVRSKLANVATVDKSSGELYFAGTERSTLTQNYAYYLMSFSNYTEAANGFLKNRRNVGSGYVWTGTFGSETGAVENIALGMIGIDYILKQNDSSWNNIQKEYINP